jgi:hypothetical protein
MKNNILVLDKISRMMSSLRSDISMLSEDLQISKKIRSQSKDASVAQRWGDLVEEARAFYQKKMVYVFCPECKCY